MTKRVDLSSELARRLLGSEYEDLSPHRKAVIDLIADEKPTELGDLLPERQGFWDHLSDEVARIGGSWRFLGGFGLFLALWVVANVLLARSDDAFDPYPFIFLNLMLSMLAAVQAPIIMMSQNRQADKDRSAAEHDYKINLRAELEIMLLHDKLDALRNQDLVHAVVTLTDQLAQLRDDVAGLKGSAAP